MHKSVFSYNLSRPYPYPWFTWVVVVGGILATALFSVVNLAADGYELIITTSSHPNATIAEASSQWYGKWSLSNKVAATFQAQNIPAGSQFYTNNTALAWTLTGIQTNSQENPVSIPSLPYSNSKLENCSVSQISMKLADINGNAELIPGDIGISIDAYASCNINTASGVSIVTLTASISDKDFGLHLFSQNSGLPNIWQDVPQCDLMWASFLLYTYGYFISRGSYNATTSIADASLYSCSNATQTYEIVAEPFRDVLSNPTDDGIGIEQPEFFFYFNECESGGFEVDVSGYVDALFKTVYSLALTDLGQSTADNILARPRLLMDFTKSATFDYLNIPVFNADDPTWSSNWFDNETIFFNKVPAQIISNVSLYGFMGSVQLFTPAPAYFKPPVVQPAVISQQYFCQVPQLKSTGSLLVAVVVADLVFLQVLWKVFNMVVTFGMERHCPDSKHCEGCAKKVGEPHGGYELVKVVDDEAIGKATGNDTAPLSTKGFTIDAKGEEPVQQGRKSGRVQTA